MTRAIHLPSLGLHHHQHQKHHRNSTTSIGGTTGIASTAERHLPLLSNPHLLLPSAQDGIGCDSMPTTCLTTTSPAPSLREEEPAAKSKPDDFARDRIQVAVRLRPILAKKNNNLKENALNMIPGWIVHDNQILQKGAVRKAVGRTVFPMDSIFAESASTLDVYEESVKPIIRSVFSGCHGTVFAYGQTGSGKTFTMQGETSPNDESRQGVIAMAANDLFAMIQNAGPQQESTVLVSYYEVYNEEVRDLLAEPSTTTTSVRPSDVTRSPFPRRVRRMQSSVASYSSSVDTGTTSGKIQKRLPVLTIRESLEGNVFVNASSETVTCAEDVLRLLRKGNLNRACAATDVNAQSSRSHAIFKLSLETRVMAPDSSGCSTDADVALKRVSWINLVDLAGSENGRHTGATGARRLEGGKINQSLLALSRVIHSLSLPEKLRPKYVGYRDSKLTRILQPSLSGSACVAILCCASLARPDLEETRSTLKFASSAKQIKVKAIVNETVGDASTMEVVKLQKELAQVKNELKQLQETMQSQAQAAVDAASTKIGRVSPLCAGCFETTGSSTTRSSTTQCSTRSHDDTTSSMVPHHRDEEEEQHMSQVYAPSLGSDSSGSVSNDSHSHTSRAVIQVDHWHSNDEEDKSLSLQDFGSEHYSLPPVQEVSVLVRSEVVTEKTALEDRIDDDADQRVGFLEDKLEATEELVEKLYSDLRRVIKELQNDSAANLNLDERLLRLEEDKENTYAEQTILLGWFILLCLCLYAIGMKEFCLSALIFLWISLQFAA